MNLTLWKFDALRLMPLWMLCAAAVLLAVVTETAPLGAWAGWVPWAGAVLGIASGWRLFADAPATRAYLFTRGLSRSRIFWNRWLLGLVGLALATGLAAAAIGLGARDLCHRALGYEDAIYYPMIRMFEFRCLPALFGTEVFAYCLTIFAVVWRARVTSKRSSSLGGALRRTRDFAALGLGALAMWVAVQYVVEVAIPETGAPLVERLWGSPACQFMYLVLWPLVATWAAAHAWRHQEIPA